MLNLESVNQSLFLYLNANTKSSPWAITIGTYLAEDLIYLVPVLLVAVWMLCGTKMKALCLEVCLVALLSLGVNQLIGLIWQHPRPFMVPLGYTWLPHVADSSFPSDHVTVFAALIITFWFEGTLRLALLAFLAGLVTAWARIYSGVHFPLDMIGALGSAGCSFLVISPIWSRFGSVITRHVIGIYEGFLALLRRSGRRS